MSNVRDAGTKQGAWIKYIIDKMTRLRQQTVERDSVGVMSDYKHKNKQA